MTNVTRGWGGGCQGRSCDLAPLVASHHEVHDDEFDQDEFDGDHDHDQ